MHAPLMPAHTWACRIKCTSHCDNDSCSPAAVHSHSMHADSAVACADTDLPHHQWYDKALSNPARVLKSCSLKDACCALLLPATAPDALAADDVLIKKKEFTQCGRGCTEKL